MKVLVLSNCAADPQTGSGSAISLVMDELAATGAEAEFVHLQQPGLGGTPRGARYLAPLRAVVEARRRLRAKRYDLVICFGGEWGLFTRLAGRARRSWKLLQYSNGVESHATAVLRAAERRSGFPGPRWFQRGDLSSIHDLAFRHADHVAVLSEFDARYLRDTLGLSGGAVTVIATPLPEGFLGRPFAPQRPRRIGYCGTWLARKNVALIQRDVQEFLRTFRDWEFEAVGPGTEALNAPGAVDPALASRMRGVGPLPRASLPGWYERCSTFLLPSAYESLGLVAAEAMACGCAVVGAPGSAFAASLRHGEEVYLLGAAESPQLATALGELARDPALRERIARGGHRQVQLLDVGRWRSRFHALLAGLGTPLPAPAGASRPGAPPAA